MNTLSPYIPVVIGLLPFLSTIAGYLYQYLIQRLAINKHPLVTAIIGQVVQAIEQTMSTAAGPDKKKAAMNEVTAILNSLHVQVDPSLVDTLIEAAVHNLPKSTQTS
jgi:hypothetical protein